MVAKWSTPWWIENYMRFCSAWKEKNYAGRQFKEYFNLFNFVIDLPKKKCTCIYYVSDKNSKKQCIRTTRKHMFFQFLIRSAWFDWCWQYSKVWAFIVSNNLLLKKYVSKLLVTNITSILDFNAGDLLSHWMYPKKANFCTKTSKGTVCVWQLTLNLCN